MNRRALHIVVTIVFLAVGAFLTWHGALRLLVHVPEVGTPGPLAVSYCAPVSRGGVDCTGVFTAPDGTTWTVTAEGADRAGVTVHAKVFPWDETRAYVRGDDLGSVLGAVGATAFGAAVLALGVTGAVMALRQARGPRRPRGT
ncbi:hypothetical protein [Catellatospora sichuanensis]|uniref:hypothetical protein n=1 Tax=Catellatospora sichuanensis TaxID=1969805 RepID=UPI0011834CBB|nr:hypothetical protein [Catellatospora sichuanensis]